MSFPPFPQCADSPKRRMISDEDCRAYGQACREQALLDAMSATLPFGKVGIVIASAIRSLK